MILSNMRLGRRTARRAQARLPRATQLAVDRDGGAQALEDLVAEGTLGLATAVDRYDPDAGFGFQYVCGLVGAPGHPKSVAQAPDRRRAAPRARARQAVRERHAELRDMLGRSPSVDELAAFLDLKPKQVERATRSGLATLSLDVPLGRSKTAKGGCRRRRRRRVIGRFGGAGGPALRIRILPRAAGRHRYCDETVIGQLGTRRPAVAAWV